ncbi:ABC transporter ATP-binding protein [Falsibacillus albus]|uniref:ABC transporter ATP-binding protein n=1 Tax=Falsibacillus albus TaxID=2478915 RepID=A0A3L7K206_9BACI|nr:ABC transporter ATP-binding protein [Falsibacillus albus]RLQ97086.1 ABC transporter ATP-binding protein [Falsibacillus albus]
MFSLHNVQYQHILRIEDMRIEKKEITCIVGESGAGKSTLLKLLNQMILPDKGEILYKGENIRDIDSVNLRRKVVMLAQQPLVFPGSIEDNLQKGLRLSEKDDASLKELDSILRAFSLQTLKLSQSIETLSGGEKQRVALGRVLLMKPEVYLLDEPTSALDDETAFDVMTEFLNRAKSQGSAVVMVTHSKMIAERFGERMIKMDKQEH